MKTKPHTIRFEEEDFKFICKRENLKTAQGVLNFLMAEYLKLYKVEKKSVFDYSYSIEDSKSVKLDDKVALSPNVILEYAPMFTEPVKPISQYDAYIKELRECRTLQEINMLHGIIKKDSTLFPKQILALENLGKELSKDFYND